MGRRNITEWVKFELSLKKKDILLKQGREKQKESGKLYGENHQKQEVLSIIDKTSEEEPHNTRNIISSEIGKSTGWVGMAEVVAKKAPEEIKEKLRKNETTVNKVYKEIKKEENKFKKTILSALGRVAMEYGPEEAEILTREICKRKMSTGEALAFISAVRGLGKDKINGVVKKIIRLFNDNRITPDEAREVVHRIGEIIRVSETE